MVLGLIGAVVLASGSLLKAISMIILGLLLAQINTDVISGTARYSFDIPQLTDGIGFVVIAMGVFGFGEIISNLGQPAEHREVFTKEVKGLWPTMRDFHGGVAVGPARHRARLDPRRAARRRRAARVVRVVHGREEAGAQPAHARSARARSRASPGPSRPTTPARRPRSSRC